MRPFLCALATVFLAWACCERTYPEPFDPTEAEPARVDVLPSHVFVKPGPKFELQARLWEDFYLLPEVLIEADPGSAGFVYEESPWVVNWSVSGTGPEDQRPVVSVEEIGESHRRALVTVSPPPPPALSNQGYSQAEVIAEWNGHKATGRLTVLWSESVSEFFVALSHPDRAAPAALLFDAEPVSAQLSDTGQIPLEPPGSVRDSLISFVGLASLGTLEGIGKAGRIAVFSQEGRSSLESKALIPTTSLNPDGADPDVIPVYLWMAALDDAGNTVPDIAEREAWVGAELELANDILRENRVGLRLVVVGGVRNLAVAKYSDIFVSNPCSTAEALEDYVDPATLALSVARIFYLPELSGRGLACSSSGFVLLDWGDRFATTLVHEFSHLAALWEYMSAIDSVLIGDLKRARNVMAEGEVSLNGTQRDHLTLGQVFRMNWDKRSIVHGVRESPFDATAARVRAEADTVRCPLTAVNPTCPGLDLDFGRPRPEGQP